MRVNLLLNNPGDVRSGYLNIDPFSPGDDPDRVNGDVLDLSHTLDDGEASELLAHDILDFCPNGNADVVLNSWLKKLAHGGQLSLSVTDLREVARAVLADRLSLEEANRLLFGEQREPWQFKKCVFTLSQLTETCQNKGYRILNQRLRDYKAYLTVERP